MVVLHKHHIVPKHAGGSDDPYNLVELTVEEHAEAHRILFEQYGRKEDELAWKGLSGQIGKEELIIELIKYTNTGRKHSKETCEKKSIALKGKSLDELHTKEKANEIRKKLSKPKTQEHKTNLSKSKLGHKQSIKTVNKRVEKLEKQYKVTSPENKIYHIKGLPTFCQNNGLDRSAMGKVARGLFNHHRGWKCERI